MKKYIQWQKLFNRLSAGGQIEMPIDENPYSTYFAIFRDKFGIEWMVKFDPKKAYKSILKKQRTPNCGLHYSRLQDKLSEANSVGF